MVSSRRATASCTRKTWVWRCLTRPTLRLEAIAFDAVASTRTRGFTTFDMSAAMATAPRALDAHSWSMRKTQLRMSLSPPQFELLPTKQRYARQASRTKTKSTLGSSRIRPVAKKTSTIGCSTCLLYTTKHLGLPFLNRTRRLRACKFLVFWLLHPSRKFLHRELQLTPVVTEIAGPHRPRSVASSTLCPSSSSEVRTPGVLTALLSLLSPICDTRIST